jgi:hypothetical protein
MRTTVSTTLEAPPDRIWEALQNPATLMYVAAPVVAFEPVEPATFPDRWDETDYRVRMRLFGGLPLGEQTIRISMRRGTDARGDRYYHLRDDGTGELMSTWDHLIILQELPDGTTRYTDDVTVEAGPLTPLVWLFAAGFYRHRQRRWRRLVARTTTSKPASRSSGAGGAA